MKTHVSILCACLVLCAPVYGQQRSVEERLSDVEKRVSALEKPSPLPLSNLSPSPTPAVETKSPLEPKQASEETKADTEAKPTPEPTEETAEMNEWYASSPDDVLSAVARRIPDRVYIQRHYLDSLAVAIFRHVPWQELAVVARHDFRGRIISHIEWSPDSKFLLFTTASSGGHSPWHAAAFLFCTADNSFRDVDAAVGSVVSPKFRFEPPDIAIMVVKKGEMPEEEVKVPLAKTMHHMPRVK